MNPEYDYALFTDEDCARFMCEFADPDTLRAFEVSTVLSATQARASPQRLYRLHLGEVLAAWPIPSLALVARHMLQLLPAVDPAQTPAKCQLRLKCRTKCEAMFQWTDPRGRDEPTLTPLDLEP